MTAKANLHILLNLAGLYYMHVLDGDQMTEIRMNMFSSQYDMKVSQQISQQGTFFFSVGLS